jgi:membrane-anchored protein YejM (alkaline phosphatase superfamily)
VVVLAPVVVGLNLIGLGWRSVSHATELSYDTQAYIPWVSFLPERELPDLVKFEPPITRGGLFEVDDIRRLGTEKARILAAEVRAEHRPNILFVHIECLRAGIFNAENMPELYRQSSGALQFLPAHYTTGPNTGIGIHGLINGLADTYYQAARQSWFHPVTLAILKKLGYSNSVYATRDLGYEQLGDLFFAETLDHAQLTNDGDFTEREARMVDRYLDDLRRDDDRRPRFDYLMFYATHFDYFFPPEFAKYQPVSSLGFEMESGRNPDRASMRDGLFNRYRNSALYVDHLVNRIVEYLRESGRLENTVVVIVGDHGEEFWEHGAFGHVYGLVNEQIHVPALVHFPRPLPASERLTSHQDFFPTIFDFMKLETLGGDCRFTTGRSLYQVEPGEDFVTVSLGIKQKNLKFTEMVIGKDYKVRIEFRDKLQVTGVFDAEDHPLADFDRDAVMRLVRQAVGSKRGDLPRCAAGTEKRKRGQFT